MNLEQHRDLDAVIVDGIRTPFVRSHKSYVDFTACQLGGLVLSGLVAKTSLDPKEIEHVVMGTVIHDPLTPNVARESVLAANLGERIPANTVSLACISANVAATQLANMIRLGQIDLGVFGGVDTCSDPPIRLSQNLRKALVKLEKVKGPLDILKQLSTSKLRFADILPDIPKVTEYSNGKSMGQGAEILAQQIGITREESDIYAARSHRLAVKAQEEGIFDRDLLSVHIPPNFKPLVKDEGPRADSSAESLGKLRPAFDKNFGVCTAGNSSFLTDGASAVLIMSRRKAKALNLKPKAVVRDYIYRAGDPLKEMLSGPAMTIPLLLERNKLTVNDIDVWEIHEAFASQVLANLKYMKSDVFAKERLGLNKAIGEIPLEKINIWGGSLSLGHPFGATGGRLILTASRRLIETSGRYAIVSGCAAGGHGSAILLANPDL